MPATSSRSPYSPPSFTPCITLSSSFTSFFYFLDTTSTSSSALLRLPALPSFVLPLLPLAPPPTPFPRRLVTVQLAMPPPLFPFLVPTPSISPSLSGTYSSFLVSLTLQSLATQERLLQVCLFLPIETSISPVLSLQIARSSIPTLKTSIPPPSPLPTSAYDACYKVSICQYHREDISPCTLFGFGVVVKFVAVTWCRNCGR